MVFNIHLNGNFSPGKSRLKPTALSVGVNTVTHHNGFCVKPIRAG